MADLSITATNVIAGAGAVVVTGTLGVAATAGEAVYLDTSTTTYKLAIANSATANILSGILLNGGAIGQPCAVITGGNYTVGATLTIGAIYILSANSGAGQFCPVADLAATWYPVVAFIAQTTTVATIINRCNNPRTAHS